MGKKFLFFSKRASFFLRVFDYADKIGGVLNRIFPLSTFYFRLSIFYLLALGASLPENRRYCNFIRLWR